MKNISINFNVEDIIKEAMSNQKDQRVLIVNIPIDKIEPAQIQRPLNEKNVEKIASEWDWNLYDPLKCTYSWGDKTVKGTDGNHRLHAAILANVKYRKNIEFLPCRIYLDLTEEEKIRLYLDQDKNKTRLRIAHKLLAWKTLGKKDVCDFIRICEKYNIIIDGYEYPPVKTYRKIGSINKSLIVINQYGSDAFEWVISIIEESGFSRQLGGFGGTLITSLASFYDNPVRNIVKRKLVEILKKNQTVKTLNKSSNSGPRGSVYCYNTYFLEELNK